jgi:hypothetical protein
MASALRVSQTTIDRIEQGGPQGRPPAWPKVQEWAEAASLAQPDLAALRQMAEAALEEHTAYRNLMDRGLAPVQEEIRAEEATAHLVRNFNPWGIPGLLQTAQYARRVLALSDYYQAGSIEQAVQARHQRQEVLHDPAHRFEFVLTEEGLRRRVVPANALAIQVSHVAAMARLPTVELSVIPLDALPLALPMFGFVIHMELTSGEQPWVAVETYHKRVTTNKTEEVDIYQAQYEQLRQSAVDGDHAIAFVREIAESLS